MFRLSLVISDLLLVVHQEKEVAQSSRIESCLVLKPLQFLIFDLICIFEEGIHFFKNTFWRNSKKCITNTEFIWDFRAFLLHFLEVAYWTIPWICLYSSYDSPILLQWNHEKSNSMLLFLRSLFAQRHFIPGYFPFLFIFFMRLSYVNSSLK